MSHRKSVFTLCLSLIMMISLSSALSCLILPGEPLFDLIIENKTTKVLTVYVDDTTPFTIRPGEQVVQRNTPTGVGGYSIVAKNSQGQTVYSRKFSSPVDMQKVDDKTFKVVIPAPSK